MCKNFSKRLQAGAFLTSAKAEVAQPAQVSVFQQKQKCQQQQDLQASD